MSPPSTPRPAARGTARFFNTAGPIVASRHYHVRPLARIDVDHVLRLVGQWKYFVLQTRAYMDRCGAAEGHLVIFDRAADRSWEDKLYRDRDTGGGAPVTVWGTCPGFVLRVGSSAVFIPGWSAGRRPGSSSSSSRRRRLRRPNPGRVSAR